MSASAIFVTGSYEGHRYVDKEGSIPLTVNGIVIDDSLPWKEQAVDIEQQFRGWEHSYKQTKANADKLRGKLVISPEAVHTADFTVDDWRKLEGDVLARMGINPGEHTMASRVHFDTGIPHIHVEISAVNFHGVRKIRNSNIGAEAGRAMALVARERGWRTAKEAGYEQRFRMSLHIHSACAQSKNIEEFREKMTGFGYTVSTNEREGRVTGLRIVETAKIYRNPSERQSGVLQGYKLSEIEKFPGQKKEKFRYSDLRLKFMANSLEARQPASQGTTEGEIKNRIPSQAKDAAAPSTPGRERQHEHEQRGASLLASLLKPTYTGSGGEAHTSHDDPYKKKKRKKR